MGRIPLEGPASVPVLVIDCKCSCGMVHKASMPTSIVGSVFEAPACTGSEPPLTPIQLRIMQCVARGETDREIAAALRLTLPQIKRAIREILIRLDSHNRAQAVFEAIRIGANLDDGRTELAASSDP